MLDPAVYGVLTVAAGAVTTFLTIRMNRKTSHEQNILTGDNNLISQYMGLLDQVQEERTAKGLEIAAIRERMDRLEERAKRRDAGIRTYVAQLHEHIYLGKPPPPPPWPADLDD